MLEQNSAENQCRHHPTCMCSHPTHRIQGRLQPHVLKAGLIEVVPSNETGDENQTCARHLHRIEPGKSRGTCEIALVVIFVCPGLTADFR